MELYNPYILIPLVAWLSAQVIKFLVSSWKGDRNLRLLYGSGGMPSAHAAAVTALTTSALVFDGVSSPIFGISAIFSGIVIYDSFGVRRASGDQAMAINAILRSQFKKQSSVQEHSEVKELLGHKPTEVIAGILLGAAVSLLMSANQWVGNASLLVDVPLVWEAYTYLGIFTALLLLGFLSKPVLRKIFKRNTPALKSLQKLLSWIFWFNGSLGLILNLAQFQSVPIFSWRIWTLGWLFLTAIAIAVVLYVWFYKLSQAHYEALKRHKRKA